jgi:hypothetical protein
MSILVKNTCYYCKKKFEKVSQCSGCHVVYYCGRKCQRLDRKDHKKICEIVKRNLKEQPPKTLEQFNENLTVIVIFPRRFYLNHKFIACRRSDPNENLNFWEKLGFKLIFERIDKLFLAYLIQYINDTTEKTLTEFSKVIVLLSIAKMQARTYELCYLFDKPKNSQVLDKVITKVKKTFQTQAQTKLKYKIKKRDYSYVSHLLQLEHKLITNTQKHCFLGICTDTFEMILQAHPLHEEMSSSKVMITENTNSLSLENMRITSLLSAALFFFMYHTTRFHVTKRINKLILKRYKILKKFAESARKNNDQNTLLYAKYFLQKYLYVQIMDLYNSCTKKSLLEDVHKSIQENTSLAQDYVPKLYKLSRLIHISMLNMVKQQDEGRFVEDIDMPETIEKLTVCEAYIHGHLFQQNQKLLKFGAKKLPPQSELVKRSKKAFTFLKKLEEGKTIAHTVTEISTEKTIEIQELAIKELKNLINQRKNFLPPVKKTPSLPLSQEPTSPKKSPTPQKLQISKFKYHPRVLRWLTSPKDVFLNDINYQHVTTNEKTWIIKIHAFPLAVDEKVKKYGLKTLWENKTRKQQDIEYSIMGSYTIESKEHHGIFSFCFDPVTEVCYHRCFTEKPIQQAVYEYFKNAKFELDFPPLNVSFKKVKKIESKHFTDGSYVVKTPNPRIVEIRNKNDDDIIRLVKMF